MAKNIQVGIKVRPMLRKESSQRRWRIVQNSIQLNDGQSDPLFFDHIFDQDDSNELIFNKMAKQIVHSVVKGINGTIFAYGQTSSGKTYTMMGDEVNPGVMVLAAQEIFREIEKASDRQFLLRVGYIEIYNERIYDLLNKKNQDLKIHETPSGNVAVNCDEFIVTCEDELLSYLCMGNKERTVGETNMNERSSRSHAIFRIIIESRKMDRGEDDSVNQSVLNLVDLAGSERADQTGARGARLKEGGHINKSLLFLSNVIKTLSENDNEKYISFRDSKLTRILQASLGGNALTSIICTVKPTAVEETQSTLNFAMRAKTVKNKPRVNEILSEAAMMKLLEKEVKRLNLLLAQEISKNESQIKVVQLEDRIKTELLKITSANSLHNMKTQKDKRRRTWCPETRQNDTCLNSQLAVVPVPTRPTKLQLPKPVKYFTPPIGVRAIPPANELQPCIEEEQFQDAELCSFVISSPNEKWDDCKTPKVNTKIKKISITPTLSENVYTHLEVVKNDLVELQEFTHLENKLDIKHDAYEAIKKRLELVSDRNVFLEAKRLEYIELKDEHKATVQKLNDCQKGCKELESQNTHLSDLNRIANEKISDYEKLFNDLKLKIEQLEMENREAVSLDFEFKTHKNKSRLRETELLDVISEKDNEINKLEKSLQARTEDQFKNSKEDLMQLSRFINAKGSFADSSDDNTENVCVKCEDLQRLLQENQKVTHEFEKLTLEYEKLQLNFTAVTKDASNSQLKLAELELKHTIDIEECEKLRTEICVLREKLEQVQADYTKLYCDNQAKTEAYDALDQEIQRAHKEMLQLQEKYQRLESVWKVQENTINDIQTEYDAIQLKYQNLQFEYEKLEETSLQTMEDCTRLQLENENLQIEINDLKVRVEEAQHKLLESAASENVSFKKTNELLQVELSELQKQFDDMQKEYDDLSNQLMDNLQEADALREQNNKFEMELLELRKQNQIIDIVQENNPELIAKIEQLTEENEQLLFSINKLRQDNELLSTENKTLLESTERTIEEMREQITKLSAELFEKSLFVDNCACEDYKNQIEDLIKERANLTSVCEHLQAQVSGFDHDHTSNNQYGKVVEIDLKTEDIESTEKTTQNEEEFENAKSNETLVGSELMINPLQYDKNAKSNTTLTCEAPMLLQNSYQDVKENIKSNSTLNENNTVSFMGSLENEQEVDYSKINQTISGQETQQLVDPLQNVKDKTEVTAFNETLTDENEIEQLNEIIKYLEKTVENLSGELAQCHQQMDSLRTAHEQQIQQLQQKLADSKAQLDCKEKEYKNERNRLELEFYEKIENNEAESRENLRKYNREWQDSKEDYKKTIARLEEKLSEEKNKLESKFEKESLEMQEKLSNAESTKQETDKAKNLLEIELSTKVVEINDLHKDLSVLEEELVTQKEITEKALHENAENKEKLLELKRTNEKLLEERIVLEKAKDDELSEKLLLQEYAEAISLHLNDMLKINSHDVGNLVFHMDKKFTSSEQLLRKLAQIDEIIEKQKELSLSKESHDQEENLKLVSKIRELENLNEGLNVAQTQTRNEQKAQLKTIHNMLETQKQFEHNIKSLEAEKLQVQTSLEALQCERAELQQNLNHCNEEKHQLELVKVKLEREKQLAEQQLSDLHRTDSERETILKDLRKQVQDFNTFISENKKLKENIEILKRDYEQNLTLLKQDIKKLQITLNEYKTIQIEMKEKKETLEMKIETLNKDLLETKVKATAYNQLLVQHEELEKLLAQTKADKLLLSKEIEQLQKKLQNTQQLQKDETVKVLELKKKLCTEEAQKAAAIEKQVELNQELKDLKEKLFLEQSAFQRETKELRSNISELQFKCRLLEECNIRQQEANKTLEAQFSAVQHKVAACESQSLLLEKLKSEKIELQARIDSTAREVSEGSTNLDEIARLRDLLDTKESVFKNDKQKLKGTIKCLLLEKKTLEEKLSATEKERNKVQLKQVVGEYNNLLDSKENSFRNDKQKLEGTIRCLLSEKKSLEEKLFAAESALKKTENEVSSLQKKCDSNSSPRSRRSLDRIVGENHQLKSINHNLEDKLASLQQRTSQLDGAERRNRRLSTHDERRPLSLWGSTSEVSTMTDPTDSNCNCVELDRKLKECERSLFIRESQVTALNMELKNHPLKSENIILKKRLVDEQEKSRVETMALRKKVQEEQEKCRIEIKKYKQIIVEQKTKTANENLAASGGKNSPAVDETKKSSLVVHAECQTESDLESTLRKLESKYNDIKIICRSRYTQIKKLQQQVESLSKGKENSDGNGPLSSFEMGQLTALKHESEKLKNDLIIYQKKYEDAKIILHSRLKEIQTLRAQLNLRPEAK